MDDLIGGRKRKINKKYECNINGSFSNLCVVEPNGKYKTHTECMKNCDGKYIQKQLQKSGLYKETNIYYTFIKKLLDMKMDVYLKGGNPMGILVLKMLSETYMDETIFKQHFVNFLSLNLIKDWDFHCYTHTEINAEYKSQLDIIAKKHKFVSRGKKFILYQTKKPIEISETALFEISIWDKDNFSDIESVMSAMKIKVTKHNLKYIFMLANLFYRYNIKHDHIDINIIQYVLPSINVIIFPHSEGFFIIDKTNFNNGGLSDDLLDIIDSFQKKYMYNPNIKQFLIAHIKEPKRMYFRLLAKNLPKSEMINKFLKEAKIAIPEWLIDSNNMITIITLFTNVLNDNINKMYNKAGIEGVFKLLQNVNFKPIKDEYIRFPQNGLNYIKKLLNELYHNIKHNLSNINVDNDTGYLIETLIFLHSKQFFNK